MAEEYQYDNLRETKALKWEQNGNTYFLRSILGSAEISTGHPSKINVLIVHNQHKKVIDGCCQNTPIEVLKSRAEKSLYRRSSINL